MLRDCSYVFEKAEESLWIVLTWLLCWGPTLAQTVSYSLRLYQESHTAAKPQCPVKLWGQHVPSVFWRPIERMAAKLAAFVKNGENMNNMNVHICDSMCQTCRRRETHHQRRPSALATILWSFVVCMVRDLSCISLSRGWGWWVCA